MAPLHAALQAFGFASPVTLLCMQITPPPPWAVIFRHASSLWCRKLNKLGTFSLSQIGKSKSPIAEFMRNQRKNNDNFEESLLKLVCLGTLSDTTCVLDVLFRGQHSDTSQREFMQQLVLPSSPTIWDCYIRCKCCRGNTQEHMLQASALYHADVACAERRYARCRQC